MVSNLRNKMMLIGIAGTPNDFLLSPYVLKCYLCQSNDINKHIDIVVQQYGSIPPTRIEEEAETILRDIEEMQPDIVGFACYVWNMDAVRLISSKLKQRHENIIIVLGGPEIATEDIVSGVFDKYAVDYFISGEGELPLLALLNSQIRIRSEDEIKNKVFELLEKVELTPPEVFYERHPHELSGGQQQRVAIARAISTEPKLIISDEAVASLDMSIRSEILKLLKKINIETKVSMIMISHDLSVLKNMCNRIAIMHLGKIVEIGDKEKILGSPQHNYTKKLISATLEIPN